MTMTAHPKIDPVTKETFAFRYGPMPHFLTYFTINSNGEKRPDVPIFSLFAFRYGPMPPFLTYFTIDSNGEKRPKYAIFNEIHGLSTGNRHICQAAVETVLAGGALRPLTVGIPPPIGYERILIPRFTANLSKRYEADAMRKTIQEKLRIAVQGVSSNCIRQSSENR
ncbi:dioxygenase 4 [Castilleja foliolosa]|uniref:Dioxygenase 4 n=1 Tax=Castilleja foliolosa TaxID=1961234 RepID=A0ABD3CM83_9LAMI